MASDEPDITQDPEEEEEGEEDSLSRRRELIIGGFLAASGRASEWLQKKGIPTPVTPETFDVDFPVDGTTIPDEEVEGRLLRLATIQDYITQLSAHLDNKIEQRKKAIHYLREDLKGRLGPPDKTINSRIDRDEEIILAEQSLEHLLSKKRVLDAYAKGIEKRYKAVSRIVEMRKLTLEKALRVHNVGSPHIGSRPRRRIEQIHSSDIKQLPENGSPDEDDS